jgi:hypothetical protein
MIEAGVDALYQHDIMHPTRPEMDCAVASVLRAMLQHRH